MAAVTLRTGNQIVSFRPDIVVRGAEGLALVAEAQTSIADLRDTEEQLKRYMVGMNCPLGLLVTRERVWVYRDSYMARSPESVERVAEFDTKTVWRERPPTAPLAFEIFVQDWLEGLAHTMLARDLPQDVGQTLSEYLMPALTGGDVRAAHPRY